MLKKLASWFVANALLSILVPVLFLSAMQWLQNGHFTFYLYLSTLTKQGFYIFSALTLYFSLFEDYDSYKNSSGPIIVIIQIVFVFATLVIFSKMQAEIDNQNYIESHMLQFIVVWILTVIVSCVSKAKIIKYKQDIRIR